MFFDLQQVETLAVAPSEEAQANDGCSGMI